MSDFSLFFGSFWPIFCRGNWGQKGAKKGQSTVKNHSFLTRIFIHATSSEKVVLFARRSVYGFQKSHYFPMNRQRQFLVMVAKVSVGGMYLLFWLIYKKCMHMDLLARACCCVETESLRRRIFCGVFIAFLARCWTFFGRLMPWKQLLWSPKTQRWGNGPRALATVHVHWPLTRKNGQKRLSKGIQTPKLTTRVPKQHFLIAFHPCNLTPQLSPTSPSKPRLEEPLHVAHTRSAKKKKAT